MIRMLRVPILQGHSLVAVTRDILVMVLPVQRSVVMVRSYEARRVMTTTPQTVMDVVVAVR